MHIVFVIVILLLTAPAAVIAQTPFSIESIGSIVGLGTADLKDTVINILQWILGILALAAVAMIIYSLIAAASAGTEDAADRARRGIFGAIIGLVIVLLAWAIVIFVAGTTANVTI